MQNLGNTCFLNSVVQCLAANKTLVQLFDCNKNVGILVDGFAQLLNGLLNKPGGALPTHEFWLRLPSHMELQHFTNYQQHDAPEFCVKLLTALDKELLASSPPEIDPSFIGLDDQQDFVGEPFIQQLTRGKKLISTYCTACSTESLPRQDFFTALLLDIPTGQGPFTLNDCITETFRTGITDGSLCNNCNVRTDNAPTTTVIQELPKMLIIQLNRFKPTGHNNQHGYPIFIKNTAAITFPTKELNLLTKDGEQKSYDLNAVSNHFGNRSIGHYTAQCRNNNLWHNCDDEEVSTYTGTDGTRHWSSVAAYMLFYNLVESTNGDELLNDQITEHEEEIHEEELIDDIDETPQPFPCAKCPHVFESAIELNRHIKAIHALTKQYSCTVSGCNQQFTSHENRNQHESIHTLTGDEPALTTEMILPPSAHTLDGWDHDSTVTRAHLLFYERTGLGRFTADTIDTDIAAQKLTPEDKARLVDSFQSEMDNNMQLLTCGSCGVRRYPGKGLHFKATELHQLIPLRLNNTLRLPKAKATKKNKSNEDESQDNTLQQTEVEVYNSFGIYKCVAGVTKGKDGHLYYLHPEFVSDLGVVDICNVCLDHTKKNARPPQSLAGGLDFGNILRVPISTTERDLLDLKQLTHVELALIANVRQYGSIFKITANPKDSRKLTGHIISFLHTGPQAAADAIGLLPNPILNLPDYEHVKDTMKVAFVGPAGTFEKLRRESTIAIHDLTVRFHVVISWLRMLKVINPIYKDITINNSTKMETDLQGLTESLLADAVCITNASHRRMDDIATSDVAMVRSYLDDDSEEPCSTAPSSLPDENANEDTCITAEPLIPESVPTDTSSSTSQVPVSCATAGHLFLSNHTDNAPDVDVAQRELLIDLKNTLFPESKTDTSSCQTTPTVLEPNAPLLPVQPIRITAQRTSNTPLNEFTENQCIFYGAFPNLFLFGKGLPSAGSLPNKLPAYLLRQFTTTFAHSPGFLFTAFNQRQRHDAARAVTARARVNPDSFQAFCNITSDAAFKELTKKAVENPKGKEAKDVLKTCSSFMKLSGKMVPFSPAARDAAMTKLYAYCQYFGMVNVFFTFAPDDVHQVLGIRLCFVSLNNTSFPADSSSLLTALTNGETLFETNIDVGESNLRALMGSNPVAAAEIYNRIQNAVYEHLLGVKPDSYSKKTVPLANTDRGIFGHTKAVFSVVETQARISLHGHCAVWAGLPPAVIQQYASDPVRIAAILACFDTMFSGQVPLHVHAVGLHRRLHRQPVTRFTYTSSPNPITHENDFNERSNTIQDGAGCHQHTGTCNKGDIGKCKCRVSKPSALIPNTCIVQLVPRTDYEENMQRDWQVKEDGIEAPDTKGTDLARDHTIYPVPDVDRRCIILEIGRPYFDLPATIEEARKIFDDELHLEVTSYDRDTWTLFFDSIGNITDATLRSKMWNLLRSRNGAIVDFSPTATSVLSCNTAALPLGSVEQGKSILIYLLKYLLKDATALAHSLVIIKDALDKVEAYPSNASDVGESTTRSGKQLIQVVLNKLTGMTELADTQAASLLLGYSAEMSTDTTTYVFAVAAVATMNSRLLSIWGKNMAAAWKEDEYPLNDIQLPKMAEELDKNDDIWQVGGDPISELHTDETIETKGRIGCASAPIYKVLQSDGNVIPIVVTQEMNYKFRGEHLATLNLYSYPCIIDIVPKQSDLRVTKAAKETPEIDEPSEEQLSDNDAEQISTNRRRNTSTCFDFDPRHPLHSTHHQRIRSKMYVPVLAGGVPPPYPGMAKYKGQSGQALQRLKEAYAIYILTLFSPWEERQSMGYDVFLPSDGTSWVDFCNYMAKLDDATSKPPTPSFINRCMAQIISNITTNLRTTPWIQKASVQYRTRATDKWTSVHSGPCYGDAIIAEILRSEGNGASATAPNVFRDDNGGLYDPEDEAAVKMIADIRALTDPAKLAREEEGRIKCEKYYKRASDDLNLIFHNPENIIKNPVHAAGRVPSCTWSPIYSGNAEVCHDVYETFKSTKVKIIRPVLPEHVSTSFGQEKGEVDVPSRLAQAILESMPNAKDPDPSEINPPPNRPTLEQYDALLLFAVYADSYSNYLRNSLRYVRPEPIHVLIHGGPGVGKTFLLNIIKDMLEATGVGCVSTAYMGVAAAMVPGSETLNTLFALPVEEKGAIKDKMPNRLSTINHENMLEKFLARHFMIVDEISLVGPVLFGKINYRTQAIAPFDLRELPFGGLSVIIVGDFFQIPPVGDTSLYKGVMDRYVHKTAEFNERDPSCPSMIGTNLFHRFKLIALNTQCRAAKDPKHGRILRLLREVSVEFPITDEILTYLHQHVLCSNDVKQPCSEWTLAPVITTGNGERFNLLLTLAIRSAITLGVPVIRWKLPLSGQRASRYTEEELDELYSQEPALWGTFVQNSSAYVKGPNVNPAKGCANGSPVTMHSLSLASREDETRIRRAGPGEIVILTKAPLYVINRIMISELEATRRPANETLVQHEAVLPLPTNSFGNRMEDVGAIGRHPAGFVQVRDHIVETGFAITFHKIQGRTIKKVILELNQRPFKPCMTYNMFLVALSRVATGDDLRIMKPVNGILGLRYLQKLRPDPDLGLWLKGFDNNGVWNKELSSEARTQQPSQPAMKSQLVPSKRDRGELSQERDKSKIHKSRPSTQTTKRPFSVATDAENQFIHNSLEPLMASHPLGLNSRDKRQAKAFIASSVVKNSNSLPPNVALIFNPEVPGGILLESNEMDESGVILIDEIVAPEIIQCSFRDIDSLNGNNYVTEMVIEQFLKRTAVLSKPERQFTILDAHFYNDLYKTKQQYNYSRIVAQRTHKPYKNGEHLNDDIFIPIQPQPYHWVIAIIRPETQEIFVIDSFKTVHSLICEHLLSWIQQEFTYYNRNDFGEKSDWNLLGFHDLPQTEQGISYPFQTDFTSCGIFSAIYAYYLMKFGNWPTTNDFTQLNIPSLRLFIASELFKSKQ